MKIELNHDVFEISKRIREIDRDYYIVYETERGVFEVHSSNQVGSSYCLTIPFRTLDERTLLWVAKTRCANIEKIMEEIDKDNQIQENADKRRVLSEFNDLASDMIKEKE